jgi:hypothetical protein
MRWDRSPAHDGVTGSACCLLSSGGITSCTRLPERHRMKARPSVTDRITRNRSEIVKTARSQPAGLHLKVRGPR